MINIPNVNVVIDAMIGVDHTTKYLRQAIKKGCHVITANKEMFAQKSLELLNLAKKNNVTIGFEATVAGGIPIIQTLKKLINVNEVYQIQGILNGTSNFILTSMRENKISFEKALIKAQEMGYAEADPTNDIEGIDAFYKGVILSELVFGSQPIWNKVRKKGNSNISDKLIQSGNDLGLRFKHVVTIDKRLEKINLTVQPVLVSENHPFYRVEGVENAILISSDIVGNICLQGPGAGMYPTSSAIIEDLIHIEDKNQLPRVSSKGYTQKIIDPLHYWLIVQDKSRVLNTNNISFIDHINDLFSLVQATEQTIYTLFGKGEICEFYQIYG